MATNYSLITNSWLSYALHKLTATERAVFECLLCFLNHQTGMAYPSQGTIREYTGLSLRTIRRAVHGLKTLNIIDVNLKHLPSGNAFGNNQYRILVIDKGRIVAPKEPKIIEPNVDNLIDKEFNLG